MLPGVEYRLWQRLGVPLLLLATTWLTVRCISAGSVPALDATAVVQDSSSSSSALDVSCHSRHLVLVSTLDGRISAIDTSRASRAGGGGALLWTLSPSDAPMLQSTLTQNMRLSQQGQWVRLVPALDGSLFKFDGEHVEPLPVTADMLLQTSHRLLDDTVISGSREVVTLGVELNTGRVRYRCTAAGCWHRQKTSAELLAEGGDSDEQQMLVLKLLTQTVRAMEPLSGVERWNFSVTLHEASIASASSAPPIVLASSCSGQLTAQLADGLVSGVHRGRRWSHRFDTPLVHVWRLSGNVLEEVDMLTETAPSVARGPSTLPRPLLYLGMHEQQMYIQQSRRARGGPVASEASVGAVVRWRPYMVSASSRTPVIYGTTPAASVRDNPFLLAADASSTTSAAVFGTSALALRSEEYPFEGGYYLYSTDCRLDEQQQQQQQNSPKSLPPNESLPPLQDIDDGVLYVVVDSLGYWWPHILLLSVSIALLMNAMITQHFRMYYRAKAAQAMRQFLRLNMPRLVVKEVAVPVPQEVIREVVREVEVLRDPAPVRSRFLLEFEPLQCLGRGGFGVVFEARNRLDSQHYAVKRISLPGRERARRKVLREVSCLAKLEHVNIVRYFYCWTEQPSPACLQEQDRVIQSSEWAWASRTPLNSMRSDAPSTGLMGSELSTGVRRIAEFDSAPPDVRSADSWRRRTVAGGVLATVDEMGESPTAGAGDLSWDDGAVVFSTGVVANGASGDSVRNGVCQTLDSSSGVFSRQVSKESPTPTPGSSLVRSFLAGGGEDSSDDEDHKAVAVKKLDESLDDSVVFSADSAMPAMDYTLPDGDPFSDDSNSSCGPVVAFQSRRGGTSGELSEDGAGEVFLFIQVQLCRKESLKDWLAAGGAVVRDRSQVLDIFLQILAGVEYVHEQGLMHRDLKPSNIFFSLDGVVKIGDFGLATGRSLCDTTTFSDTVVDPDVSGQHTDQVGTRLYMSPEQTAGVGSDYDYRVDIYALGIVLLELLVPFDTQMERLATLTAARRGLLPSEFRSRCPDEAELVAAMLSHQPVQRPSIAEIRRRCQRLITRTDTTGDVGHC